MTDEKKSETEVKNEDAQEKTFEEILEEKNQEIEKLKSDLEKSESETQEYISLSQRLQADFENFKKITEKRNKDLVKFANENVLKEFLDCYEDFGRALETENDEDLRNGIQLIYNKFSDVLKKEGIEETEITSWINKIIREELPDFYIPKKIVFIEDLPLTSINKVDYKKLEEQLKKDKSYTLVKKAL